MNAAPVADSNRHRRLADRRSTADDPRRIAHGYYTLYRIVQASALLALALWNTVGANRYTINAPQALTAGYLLWSLLWLVVLRAGGLGNQLSMLYGLVVDIVVVVVFAFLPDSAIYGTRVLLVVPIAAGALLLRGRLAIFLAALAASGVLLAELLRTLEGLPTSGGFTDSGLMGSSYFAVALVVNYLAGKAAVSETLAHERGVDLTKLAALNQLILHRMHTGIVAIDLQHRVRFLNPSANRLMAVDEAGGTPLKKISPTLYRRMRLWQAGKSIPATPITLAPDSMPVLPRFSRVDEEQGVTLIFLEDTTVLARHAEAMTLTSLGKLAASIAHEIRNPLGAVSHAAQLLMESESIAGNDRHLADIITSQAQRMDAVVENVLSLAQRSGSTAVPVDLRDLVNEFAERLQPGGPGSTQVTIDTLLPDEPARTLIDPAHVLQILTSLGDNAQHHGRNALKQCHIRVRLTAGRQPGAWRLAVCDTGPGVPINIRKKIFEPFFTTREEGTGLGLFVVKSLCDVNRIRIVYEQSDQWKCFVLRFPRNEDPLQAGNS